MLLLHGWNLVEKDLIPLLLNYRGEASVFLDSIKLLVFLTLPADQESSSYAQQRRCILNTLTALLQSQEIIPVLFSALLVSLERYEVNQLRSNDEDAKVIQLFLTLIRNLLAGTDYRVAGSRGQDHVVLKEKLLTVLFDLQFPALLSQMAKDARKNPFTEESALLVEIFDLLFLDQNPSLLALFFDQQRREAPSVKAAKNSQSWTTCQQDRHKHVRHSRFGSRVVSASSGDTVNSKRTGFRSFLLTRRSYFGKATNFPWPEGSPHKPLVQHQLAQLAADLSSGGFNELILAALSQLRHQSNLDSEEYSARLHGFLGISSFFIHFFRIRFNSGDDAVQPVTNVLDKNVLFWLLHAWHSLEEAKDVHGLIRISGLVKEMFLFLDDIIRKYGHADQFASKALASAVLIESKDNYLHFYLTAVKRYDSNSVPFVYLANILEGLHAVVSLMKQTDLTDVTLPAELMVQSIIDKHVQLLAFWHLNSQELNKTMMIYLGHAQTMGKNCLYHSLKILVSLHGFATGHNGHTPFSSDIMSMQCYRLTETPNRQNEKLQVIKLASVILVDFMKALNSSSAFLLKNTITNLIL